MGFLPALSQDDGLSPCITDDKQLVPLESYLLTWTHHGLWIRSHLGCLDICVQVCVEICFGLTWVSIGENWLGMAGTCVTLETLRGSSSQWLPPLQPQQSMRAHLHPPAELSSASAVVAVSQQGSH